MGIGHLENSFFYSGENLSGLHRFSHGGELRKKKLGRKARPLSTKEPLHVVFKVQSRFLRLRHKSLRAPQSFKLVLKIIKKYALHFGVKVEQLSVQNDHIHLLVRSSRRSPYHHFFRVVAGQIAQNLAKEGLLVTDTQKPSQKPQKKQAVKAPSLWKHRPFSRLVRSFKAYKTIRNYIQLNEKEALGEIKYQKRRLKGLSTADWQLLWA